MECRKEIIPTSPNDAQHIQGRGVVTEHTRHFWQRHPNPSTLTLTIQSLFANVYRDVTLIISAIDNIFALAFLNKPTKWTTNTVSLTPNEFSKANIETIHVCILSQCTQCFAHIYSFVIIVYNLTL